MGCKGAKSEILGEFNLFSGKIPNPLILIWWGLEKAWVLSNVLTSIKTVGVGLRWTPGVWNY